MSSVLITGAGGLIGRHVVEAARNAGYSPVPVFHNSGAPRENAVRLDLRQPLSGVPPVSAIFHLAGGYVGAGRRALEEADLAVARNVIAWGAGQGVKTWILSSAAEVYGCISGEASEDTPVHPIIPYGEVKVLVEEMFARVAGRVADSRVVLLRIGEVYGPESRLLRELTLRLRRGFCPLPGLRQVALSFVHVEDVAQAFVRAAERAPHGVSIYNVADGEPATWRAFVSCFAEKLGAHPPFSLPMPLVYAYLLGHNLGCRIRGKPTVLTRNVLRLMTTPKVLSTRRIRQELGFRPRYANYREGLEAAVDELSHHA